MGKYYITTTLPYVNAEPHIGFAMEIVRADCLARLHRALGDEVFFNTGTDEHGQKIYQKAVESGRSPQDYCDEYAEKFTELKKALNLSYNSFIRTTDKQHVEAAQEFWVRCAKNGDIYKRNYKVKYCVGCELEKSDSELDNGKCPLHPTQEIQMIEEENYFFRFSKYQERLLDLYQNRQLVVPDFRLNEIISFVKSGLQDFSISRLKSKMPWGVEVPGDDSQVMYVWFDALVNYISALGWPKETKEYADYWPGTQICGKDNLRQQTAMWQAMLMSAGLPTSKQIFVGGFLTLGGQKISKSLGNTINPAEWSAKYGVDALRYYLLSEMSPYSDSDITEEKFTEAYQSNLSNGLGNLAARVATMAERAELTVEPETVAIRREVNEKCKEFRFDEAMDLIWDEVRKADLFINQKEVWKLDPEEQKAALTELIKRLRQISADLAPFMPETAAKLLTWFGGNKIVRGENLFPRIV